LPSLPGSTTITVAEPAPARASNSAIRIGKAVRGDLNGILTFTAQLRSKGEVAIVPRVTARVDRLAVDVGSRVRAGDTLVELDRTQLEQQVLEAQAAQASAEARLAELKAGPKAEVVAQAQANQKARKRGSRALESARAAGARPAPKRVSDARAALDQAQAALADAQAIATADTALTAARNRLTQLRGRSGAGRTIGPLDTARNDVQKARRRSPGQAGAGTQAAVEDAQRARCRTPRKRDFSCDSHHRVRPGPRARCSKWPMRR
jgi:multidrug efflux pump subunit AcrA (membrane-fusion protein)